MSSDLALLIAAPHAGDVAMHHDLDLVHAALLRRGVPAERVLRLEGRLDRTLLLDCAMAAGRTLERLRVERLLLHVTGHGFFVENASGGYDVGLELSEEDAVAVERVAWAELFAALRLRVAVKTTLLPDH